MKIWFVSQVALPSYDSFFSERQIDSIKESGKPIKFDELSYQGRIHVGNGLFYYLLAIMSVIIPSFLLFKYLAVVLGIISIILVFLITEKLFPSKWIALLTSILAALSPSLFSFSLNTVSPELFFMFFYLLLIYLYVGLDKSPNKILAFVLIFIFATLTSSLILSVVLGLGIYFLLLRLEFLPLRRREFEIFFFSGLFALWYYVLLFKKLFFNGIQSLWNNIPGELLSNYFSGMTVSLALALVGFIPMLLGFYAIYVVLFKERNRKLLFLISLVFSWGLLVWLGLIPFKSGVIFGTLTLVLLSAYTLNKITIYFKKTKISFLRPVLAISLLIIIFLAFIPVFSYVDVIKEETPTENELETMIFIEQNTPVDSTVLGEINDGHLISAVAKRKNFFDTRFIFAPQAQQRYADAEKIFLTRSEVVVKQLFNTYNIDYLYLSTNTERVYGEQKLFEESSCFELLFETNQTKVYEFACENKN
ncbi:MAG: hypothetical protein U9R00_00155 [Patescibacteria group bacterium]|nr:hypothetical protein [Patescibacteria group bacterium]